MSCDCGVDNQVNELAAIRALYGFADFHSRSRCMYFNGQAVEIDQTQTLNWFQKAADQAPSGGAPREVWLL